jgi:hypothetical protein
MKLAAPTIVFFLVSLALVVMAVVGHFQPSQIPAELVGHRFWLAVGGYALLVLGMLFRGK